MLDVHATSSSLHASSDLPRALTGRGFSRYPRSNVFFFALAPEDADALQRVCGLLAGAAMVARQSLVAVGVLVGTISPACGSSDQCPQAGTYCAVGARDRCRFCGEDSPLPPQTDPTTGVVLNQSPEAPDFAGFNLTAVTVESYSPVGEALASLDPQQRLECWLREAVWLHQLSVRGEPISAAALAQVLESILSRRLVPLENPTLSGDRIFHQAALAVPKGARGRILGCANIKGAGLGFVAPSLGAPAAAAFARARRRGERDERDHEPRGSHGGNGLGSIIK